MVRIASNQPGNEAVLAADAGDMGIYAGNSYRSVTFELANYNPFRFGARVKYAGEDWKGKDDEPDRSASAADIPEVVTPLVWTYQPEQEVDIAIDVTSFCGSDGNSVDPFGNEFEIYIDAPMLKIDENRLAANKLNGTKLKADPAVPGRFIYTVEADREAERNYGTNAIENIDNTTTISVNQNGERKTLPFITNSIVSAGDITISSNEKQVVYYSKTFRVTNRSITGTLRYAAADGVKDVPVGAFVSFERVGNNSRIGSVTVTAVINRLTADMNCACAGSTSSTGIPTKSSCITRILPETFITKSTIIWLSCSQSRILNFKRLPVTDILNDTIGNSERGSVRSFS